MTTVLETVLLIPAWSRAHCEDIVSYCTLLKVPSSANLGEQQGISLSSSLSSPLQDADAGPRIEEAARSFVSEFMSSRGWKCDESGENKQRVNRERDRRLRPSASRDSHSPINTISPAHYTTMTVKKMRYGQCSPKHATVARHRDVRGPRWQSTDSCARHATSFVQYVVQNHSSCHRSQVLQRRTWWLRNRFSTSSEDGHRRVYVLASSCLMAHKMCWRPQRTWRTSCYMAQEKDMHH